jgi:hypothetical protein
MDKQILVTAARVNILEKRESMSVHVSKGLGKRGRLK